MIRLSVNINKFATLRNARGGNVPNVLQAAKDCERFGAQGITVHPRPDERHIRYRDVLELKDVVKTEFNIEGYPAPDWISLVKKVQPAQATLVPDGHDVLTSDRGWNTVKHGKFLRNVTDDLRQEGMRVSIFVDPDPEMVRGAAQAGADRIELYTGPFADRYRSGDTGAISPYISAAEEARRSGLGINAGHDLNLKNLHYFALNIPGLLEVSIGHALICDALWYGLENAIQMYRRQLVTDKEPRKSNSP